MVRIYRQIPVCHIFHYKTLVWRVCHFLSEFLILFRIQYTTHMLVRPSDMCVSNPSLISYSYYWHIHLIFFNFTWLFNVCIDNLRFGSKKISELIPPKPEKKGSYITSLTQVRKTIPIWYHKLYNKRADVAFHKRFWPKRGTFSGQVCYLYGRIWGFKMYFNTYTYVSWKMNGLKKVSYM